MLSHLSRLSGHADLALRAYQLSRSESDEVRQAARRHLVARMGKMRGIPQKIGQMLSFSARDCEAQDDFEPLLESAEPLAWKTIASILKQTWQRPWKEVLRSVNQRGQAASLGQVHQAVLLDGRQVAIKVQYPDIQNSVQTDLSLLGWLSTPATGFAKGFDLAGYRQAIMQDLARELDYQLEAENQRAFTRQAEENAFLVVPEVIDELSTSSVLVSEWETGDTWDTVLSDWSDDERRALGNAMVAWFLRSLFVEGIIHADLHPGNVRFRRTATGPQLVLYDFGCVYRPTDTERWALLRLIQSTATREENPWPLMLAMGFDADYLEPLAAKLPALCQVLFEPLTSASAYDAAQWKLGERVADILGEQRWNFRVAGPPAMVLLLRAFHGLKYYLEGLRVPVLWSRAFRDAWKQEGEVALAKLVLPAVHQPAASFDKLARQLKIRVCEAGRTKVELSCPAVAIESLERQLDDELLLRIRAQGHDLASITCDIRRRGYTPGPVFSLCEQGKEVCVWLE